MSSGFSEEDVERIKRFLNEPEVVEMLSHSMDLNSLELESKRLEGQIKTKEEELEQLRTALKTVKQCIEEKSQGFIHQKELYHKLEKIARKQKKIAWLHATCYPGQFNQELNTPQKYSFALCVAKLFNRTEEFYGKFGTEDEYRNDNPAFDKLMEYVESLLK